MSRKLLTNLKGSTFVLQANKYYNLSTGKYVTKYYDSLHGYVSIRGLNVIGHKQDIVEFSKLNNIQYFMTYDPFHVRELVKRLENDYFTRGINSDKLGSLRENNMFIKGKIKNIVDGDTVDVEAKIRIKDYVSGSNMKLIKPLLSFNSANSALLCVLRIRLYGMDAAEKDTIAGQCAKQLLEKYTHECDGNVNILLTQPEKYGRSLGVIYDGVHENFWSKKSIRNKMKSRCWNVSLVEFGEETGYICATSYTGGEKKDIFSDYEYKGSKL